MNQERTAACERVGSEDSWQEEIGDIQYGIRERENSPHQFVHSYHGIMKSTTLQDLLEKTDGIKDTIESVKIVLTTLRKIAIAIKMESLQTDQERIVAENMPFQRSNMVLMNFSILDMTRREMEIKSISLRVW